MSECFAEDDMKLSHHNDSFFLSGNPVVGSKKAMKKDDQPGKFVYTHLSPHVPVLLHISKSKVHISSSVMDLNTTPLYIPLSDVTFHLLSAFDHYS